MADNSSDQFGLQKFGEATKTLAEIFKDACGIVIDPVKKITVSAAERFNERRNALQKFELERMELAERAKTRQLETEIRRQENLELIAKQATELLPLHANPENLNIDWLHIAMDYCKDISEKELQNMWANILSTEATKANSISRKTLDVIKSFSKQDCFLFNDIAKYFIPVENEGKGYAIVLKEKIPIDYDKILELGYLGILNPSKISFQIHRLTETNLNGQKINIINDTGSPLSFSPIHNISRMGLELMRALRINQDNKYFESFIEDATAKGAKIKRT